MSGKKKHCYEHVPIKGAIVIGSWTEKKFMCYVKQSKGKAGELNEKDKESAMWKQVLSET